MAAARTGLSARPVPTNREPRVPAGAVRQLPLPLRLDRLARFDSFHAGSNAALVAHLEQLAAGRRGDVVWLWSGDGAGKSHLLQAACRAAAGRRAMYLPLGGGDAWSAGVLSGLGGLDLVAVDDVERVAGDPDWERALFSLFNDFQGRSGGALLLAARTPPAATGFTLPDLASRARGAVVYRVAALDDEGRRDALIAQARLRGVELEPAAADYLVMRVARDMRVLCAWLDRLDREALVAQRRLTIPFIRAALRAPDAGSD